jgi:hypothetical protein
MGSSCFANCLVVIIYDHWTIAAIEPLFWSLMLAFRDANQLLFGILKEFFSVTAGVLGPLIDVPIDRTDEQVLIGRVPSVDFFDDQGAVIARRLGLAKDKQKTGVGLKRTIDYRGESTHLFLRITLWLMRTFMNRAESDRSFFLISDGFHHFERIALTTLAQNVS